MVFALHPVVSDTSESDPVGGLLVTEAKNFTVMLIFPSLAVTDMSVEPQATGVLDRVDRETLTVTYIV